MERRLNARGQDAPSTSQNPLHSAEGTRGAPGQSSDATAHHKRDVREDWRKVLEGGYMDSKSDGPS